jgi:photosystem II stability/assembly factor-like uncharacterized protein
LHPTADHAGVGVNFNHCRSCWLPAADAKIIGHIGCQLYFSKKNGGKMRRQSYGLINSILDLAVGKRELLWFFMIVVFIAGTVTTPHLEAGAVRTYNSSAWMCSLWSNSPTTKQLNDIRMVSGTIGWAVGENSTLLKWDGISWTQLANPTNRDMFLYGVDMFSADNGWIVGWDSNGSVLLKWNGIDWLSAGITGANERLLNVRVLPPNTGWAVGTLYSSAMAPIMRLEGNGWITVTNPATGLVALKGISIVNPNNVWVVGSPGKILHWGGSGWTFFFSPTSGYLRDIDMVSATDGWIVGDYGLILRFDGTQWNVFPSPVTTALHSIRMTSATDGWAVGIYGTVLHWDGAAWIIVPTGVVAALNAVDVTVSDSKWIVGENGIILHCQPNNLVYAVYLPIVLSNYATPMWNGMTEQNLEMSFDFINNDIQWNNFRMKVRFGGMYPGCDFVLNFENPGPGDVVNDDFSGWIRLGTKGAFFNFDGHLTSSSIASGTYEIGGSGIAQDRCGNLVAIDHSGTWSASR